MGKRIYEEKTELNNEKVYEFWESRAKTYSEEDSLSAVKFSKSKDGANIEWDKEEKDLILSKLNIDKQSCVIDIGCGVGRMAESMLPLAKYYLGVDYSINLIEIARKRYLQTEKSDFFAVSALDLNKKKLIELNVQNNYEIILIIGLFPYLNDCDVLLLVENLLTIAEENCEIYITLSEANEQRLTLQDWESKDIGSEYNVIYRTFEEYKILFEKLFQAGFEIKEYEKFLDRGHLETTNKYLILRRG